MMMMTQFQNYRYPTAASPQSPKASPLDQRSSQPEGSPTHTAALPVPAVVWPS